MGLEGFHIHEVVLGLSGSGLEVRMPFLRLGKNRTTRRKTSLFASFSFINCPTLVHQANEWLVFIGCQVVYFFLLNTKTTFRLTRQDNVYLAPYNGMKYPNGSIPQI